jgi:hypothetical protein
LRIASQLLCDFDPLVVSESGADLDDGLLVSAVALSGLTTRRRPEACSKHQPSEGVGKLGRFPVPLSCP